MAGSCQVHPQLRQSAIRYVASHSVASSLDAKEEASGPHLVGRTSLAMALPPTDAGGEGMMPMERLTAEDELMLWPDEIWPQDIGALAVLDGSSLLDRDGRVSDGGRQAGRRRAATSGTPVPAAPPRTTATAGRSAVGGCCQL